MTTTVDNVPNEAGQQRLSASGGSRGADPRHGSHSKGKSALHLQFTPAYRAAIFTAPAVRQPVAQYLSAAATAMGICIAAIEFGPDHVHLLVTGWARYAIPEIARYLKTYSSRMMRKNHRELTLRSLWGKKFWSAGYYYSTAGDITADTIRRYIEHGQNKHWTRPGETAPGTGA